MAKYLFSLLTIVSFCSCKSQQKIAAENLSTYSKNVITFGNGGGFASIETTYTLLENGQLFSTTGLENKTIALSTLNKKQTKSFFEKASKINWSTALNAPGNTYKFIALGNQNNLSKIIWGNNQQFPTKEISELYESLITIIPKK